MPHLCPVFCGRLATAAVFVSVAVVQLIAGLILLKSKYVYLLSGPNFWTAASNLAVGVLLGVSVTVWKDIEKKPFKHLVRRNLIASLVASAFLINSTTAVILILGEGNTLLSIRLENDGKESSATLKSEFLAYSYAASVCSPIISAVVAVVFLSGLWFRIIDEGMKTPQIKSILKKKSVNEYDWVFEKSQPPPLPEPRNLRNDSSFKSLSSSSSEESFSSIDAEFWSNPVHSIEYLNSSLQRGIKPCYSKILQETNNNRGKHLKHALENVPHEASRVSFADDMKTINFLKFSPNTSLKHTEMNAPFQPDPVINGNSLSYSEFKKMHRHYKNLKQSHKKRSLLKEHPGFRQSEFFRGNINANKLAFAEFRIPRAHATMAGKSKSSTSEVKAEVHTDSKSHSLIGNGNSPESPVYRKDVPSCTALTKNTHSKDTQLQRVSTLKHLNNSDACQVEDEEFDSVFTKVYRTSTAAGLGSSKISQLDISDIETDSLVNQIESCGSEEMKQNKTATNFRGSSEVTASQIESAIEMDDSFADLPQSNSLAGEVIEVKVNTLPRKSFHSKLIPVSIPVVSSVKINHLKQKQKGGVAKETDKFSCSTKPSSFHGDLKAMKQNISPNEDEEKRLIQNYKANDDAIVCDVSPECITPPSPAQTSGYASAIFESTNMSGSKCFPPNISSSSTSSPFYTPKKMCKNPMSPMNLIHKQ